MCLGHKLKPSNLSQFTLQTQLRYIVRKSDLDPDFLLDLQSMVIYDGNVNDSDIDCKCQEYRTLSAQLNSSTAENVETL